MERVATAYVNSVKIERYIDVREELRLDRVKTVPESLNLTFMDCNAADDEVVLIVVPTVGGAGLIKINEIQFQPALAPCVKREGVRARDFATGRIKATLPERAYSIAQWVEPVNRSTGLGSCPNLVGGVSPSPPALSLGERGLSGVAR